MNSEETSSGSQNLNEVLEEDAQVAGLKAKVDELNDKYLRQAAEFDNFRRRNAKERIELVQTAGKEVITDLLDVLDDCDRAQKQLEAADDIQQVKEGVQLVFSKLRNVLTGKGLKPIDAKGKEFNVDQHEAITEIEAGPDWKGKVIDEVQKGYYLNDKIIRYAKVVVGK
ncbi:nucleotide exchange factor GrpE [Paraflavisolibacter sp. H34]|uniref:nucleotide exchange factor GrpE n=1 Tax=Huijunlia imazamoxiresistens TaxID=3127457 RepID=UPI003018347D